MICTPSSAHRAEKPHSLSSPIRLCVILLTPLLIHCASLFSTAKLAPCLPQCAAELEKILIVPDVALAFDRAHDDAYMLLPSLRADSVVVGAVGGALASMGYEPYYVLPGYAGSFLDTSRVYPVSTDTAAQHWMLSPPFFAGDTAGEPPCRRALRSVGRRLFRRLTDDTQARRADAYHVTITSEERSSLEAFDIDHLLFAFVHGIRVPQARANLHDLVAITTGITSFFISAGHFPVALDIGGYSTYSTWCALLKLSTGDILWAHNARDSKVGLGKALYGGKDTPSLTPACATDHKPLRASSAQVGMWEQLHLRGLPRRDRLAEVEPDWRSTPYRTLELFAPAASPDTSLKPRVLAIIDSLLAAFPPQPRGAPEESLPDCSGLGWSAASDEVGRMFLKTRIDRIRPYIAYAYQRRLPQHNRLVGMVSLALHIDPDGLVHDVTVGASTLTDAAFEAVLVELLDGLIVDTHIRRLGTVTATLTLGFGP